MSDLHEQVAAAGQTAAAYIEKKYGAGTRLVTLPQTTVTTTPVRLLANNPRRLFWIIVNTFVAQLMIGFDGTIGPNVGMIVGPQGGAISMSIDEDGEEVTRDVWGAAITSSTLVYGWEIMRK